MIMHFFCSGGIQVNKLESVKTQLPYDFYSLPFCAPTEIIDAAENLGEVLTGDDIQNSAYEIYMRQTDACKILCKKTYTEEEMKKFRDFVVEVRDAYRAQNNNI